MAERLTVIIPCKNELQNIRACIESAALVADEILVADSGSTDGTLDLVREIGGCRIIEREYVYSADFKNWAIPQATHAWVMVLDADERISPELAQEIGQVLEAPDPAIDGYWMPYLCYFMGHAVHFSRWSTDSIRLFRRDVSRYHDRRVHAEIDLPASRLGKFRGKLHHYSYWTYQEYILRYDRYTTWGALDLNQRGRQAGLYDLMIRPFTNFFYRYVIRGGFLDGMPGLQLCMLQAFYSSFMKYGKLWEMQHGIEQPTPESSQTVTTIPFPQREAEGLPIRRAA